MRTIHKHVINHHPRRPCGQVPHGGRVIHVESQTPDPREVSVWFDVNDTAPLTPRIFEAFVTGGRIPLGAGYVSTHLLAGGAFVLHLFEVTPA